MSTNGQPKLPDHIARLLASSIETEERLEILMHLRALRGKSVASRAVATACGTTAYAAEQHLAILCGRGFLAVSIGSDLLYAYRPLSPSIRCALDELEQLMEARRTQVLAALKDIRSRDPARVFANAFLIRSDNKKEGA